MVRYITAQRMSGILLTLALILTATTVAGARDIRYNGIVLTTLGVDTAKINQKLPDTYGDLGGQIVLLGVEGVAGDLGGWVVGGFGFRGELTSAREASNRAEFEVALAGVTVETLLVQQPTREITVGARVGGGKYTLRFVQTASENSIVDLTGAAGTATSTTVQSPVWYFEPAVGMRSQLGDYLVLEGRLGYGISMSNGEWSYGNNRLNDTVNVTMGGFVLNLGLKLISF